MHKDIDKACAGIHTRKSVCIRKVKLQKKPWFDLPNLVEVPSSYPPAGGHLGSGGWIGWPGLCVLEARTLCVHCTHTRRNSQKQVT